MKLIKGLLILLGAALFLTIAAVWLLIIYIGMWLRYLGACFVLWVCRRRIWWR